MIVLAGLAGSAFVKAQVPPTDAPLRHPLRAMLWLQPETYQVLDRVRGQTNDLAVDLLVDGLEPTPNDLNAQLQTAYLLGARQDAALVIWFVKQPDAEHHFVVHIAVPKTQRLLTRDLGPGDLDSGTAGLSSAAKEGAALVVRAAIQAVLSGSTIGEVQVTRIDEPPPPPPSTTATSAPHVESVGGVWRDTTEAARHPSSSPSSALAGQTSNRPERNAWPWAIGFAWLMPYDGADHHKVAECALLRAGRRVTAFDVFVAASDCLQRDIGGTYGTVRLKRQQVGIGAAYVLWQTGLQASLGVQASAVFYERQTAPFPLGKPAPSTTHIIGSLGPEFRLLVPARGSRVQAGLVLGVDFLTNSLSIVYTGAGINQQVAQVNAVQPYLALGVGLRL